MLLAGAAASPAFAQDEGRWHRHDGNADHAQAQEQRQQQHQQQAQQQQAANAEVRQEQRGGFDGRRFEGRSNAEVQTQAQQQAVQQQQFDRAAQSGFAARERAQEQQWRGRQAVQSQQWQGRQAAQSQQWQGRQVQSQQWQGRQDAQSSQWQGRTGSYGHGSWSQSGTQGSRWSGNWNRNWRDDSRYDWRRYRNSHRSLFSLGIYFDPFGYGYRSFDIGYRFQPAYFGQQYWIDPALYGLPYPPPGTQWVRYWNDAVLVDMYSGQVVDVIHDFFW